MTFFFFFTFSWVKGLNRHFHQSVFFSSKYLYFSSRAGWDFTFGLCGLLHEASCWALAWHRSTKLGSEAGQLLRSHLEQVSARNREREEMLLNNAHNLPHQKPPLLDLPPCRCRWKCAPRQVPSASLFSFPGCCRELFAIGALSRGALCLLTRLHNRLH